MQIKMADKTKTLKRFNRKQSTFRRQGSTVERMREAIFGDVPLTDAERRFLLAAEDGNFAEVKECLEENSNLNVNCVDYLGRSALHLAVTEEDHNIINYLLDRCNLDVIENGLMCAILEDNVKICDLILNHKVYSNKKYRLKLEFQHEFYDQDESNPFFSSDMKPIVLAAHRNDFEIIHLLLKKGFTLKQPHDYFCMCTECKNHKEFDSVVHSKSRLSTFRALASSAYISLSSDDPILTAFKLSRQLEHLSQREKQYKFEYQKLSEECKAYAVELFSLCRTHEEVLSALHADTGIADLTRIKLAIKYDQKKFIAHSSCQEHLMNMWYGNMQWVRHMSMAKRLVAVPVTLAVMPLLVIVYLIAPRSKIGQTVRVPIVKFMNYMFAYMVFLLLLFIDTNRSPESHDSANRTLVGGNGTINLLILLYVMGMFWGEVKQLWEEGAFDYFHDIWNWMDITMISLYAASYSIQFVVNYKIPEKVLYDDEPVLVANILFAVANLLSFCRIVYLLPASETFGQLQITYGRMLGDVLKFLVIYFTVMMAFVCCLSSLYSRHATGNEYFDTVYNSFMNLYFATFGMGRDVAPKIEMNAESGREDVLTMYVGYFLYGAYLLAAVVVLINMLIAMMSNSFQEVHDEEDMQWKFARAKLWICYIQQGSSLPIPFNIIPTPKAFYKVLLYLRYKILKCMGAQEEPEEENIKILRDHKAIMHKVVLRFIHKMKFQKKDETLKDEILDVKEDTVRYMDKMSTETSRQLQELSEGTRLLVTEVRNINRKIYNIERGVDSLDRRTGQAETPMDYHNNYQYNYSGSSQNSWEELYPMHPPR